MRKLKLNIFLVSLLFSGVVLGQRVKDSTSGNTKKGEFSFGVRSTGSIFSASNNNFGIGTGWQFRIRVSEQLNTEWFADWITTDIDGMGQRFDMHIGESMMIYPFKNVGAKNTFSPYILGGFCGDYTKIQTNIYYDSWEGAYTQKSKDRWSFATQLGLGTSYNFTERFDITFTTQYVLHFGADLSSNIVPGPTDIPYLAISTDTGGGLEGHVFFAVSANYMFADLMKKK